MDERKPCIVCHQEKPASAYWTAASRVCATCLEAHKQELVARRRRREDADVADVAEVKQPVERDLAAEERQRQEIREEQHLAAEQLRYEARLAKRIEEVTLIEQRRQKSRLVAWRAGGERRQKARADRAARREAAERERFRADPEVLVWESI